MTTPQTAAGKALLDDVRDFQADRAGWAERIAAIEAEARATAEAEIAELRTLVGELSAGCLRGIECSNPVHIRAARLLAAPPTEPRRYLLDHLATTEPVDGS